MTKWITQTFFKGMAIVLPVVATVYVIMWLVGDTEAVVKRLLLLVMPDEYYVPGIGVLVVLVAVFAVGLLMYPWLTRKMLNGFDDGFRRIPLFGSIYGPVRDLMNLIGGDMTENFGEVVMITVPNTNMETLGFITRKDLSDLPEGFVKEDHVVVYVQWSSQIGGYCFIVPKDSVRFVDMTVEEGIRWALTAGISGPNDRQNGKQSPTESLGKK